VWLPTTPREWWYIVISGLGFSVWVLVDIPPLANRPGWARGLTLLSALGLAGVFVLTTVGRTPWPVPQGVRLLGWAGLLVGVGLLVYSTVLEIPLRQRRRRMLSAHVLVQEGTYALCRHPGALWMGLFVLGWVLAFPGPEVARVAASWFVMELIVVWIQDRWTLPRRLPGYTLYQRTTPFLIPTRASLKAAWHTWRRRP